MSHPVLSLSLSLWMFLACTGGGVTSHLLKERDCVRVCVCVCVCACADFVMHACMFLLSRLRYLGIHENIVLLFFSSPVCAPGRNLCRRTSGHMFGSDTTQWIRAAALNRYDLSIVYHEA